ARDPQGSADVLERPLAKILEPHLAAEALAYLLANRGRDTDAVGLGQRLQACGDVDAIAEDVAVLLDDHIAEVDADPESDPAARRNVAIGQPRPALDLDG